MQKELTVTTLAGKAYTFRPVPMSIMPSADCRQWLRFQGAHLPGSQLSEITQDEIQRFMNEHKTEALTDGLVTVTLAGGMLALCRPERVLTFVRTANDRYVFGDWSHIFHANGADVPLRFVFDRTTEKVVFMEIRRSRGWKPADHIEISDLEDSLKNANDDALDDPEEHGLKSANIVPSWAKEVRQ